MITQADDFFTKGCGRCTRFATPACNARLWAGGLAELRGICLSLGLVETAKWGHPTYMHHGRNIAIFGAFAGDMRISFMEAGLLEDPAGHLEKAGPNSATPSVLRFVDAAEVTAKAPLVRDFLQQLMRHAESGRRAPPVAIAPDMPEELARALDDDPSLAEAFAALTPGRRKSYLILVAGAKQPATRMARIAKARDRILAGKGAQER